MYLYLKYFFQYFFRPSSLDALVFGYVAPLLKAPLSNSQLANHVKGCPNLSGLCNRILSKYLPMSPEGKNICILCKVGGGILILSFLCIR